MAMYDSDDGVASFEHIFTPIRINGLDIANRIVMAPMASHYANQQGHVTEQLIRWYEARAEGGAGLIITESNYVRSDGRGGLDRLGLHHDSVIPGHGRLVDAIHRYPTRILAQLHHAGRLAPIDAIGQYPVGPSATPYFASGASPLVGTYCRALTRYEIGSLVECFASSARRAREAGYDGLHLHGAHGYLINQFLSARTNIRTDEYGGDILQRARFLVEVLRAIRGEVGASFPVFIRLSAEEKIPEGYRFEDILRVVEAISPWVDEVDLSGGTHDSYEWMIPPKSTPRGCYTEFSKLLKRRSTLPVGVVGRIKTPEDADAILRDGASDLVFMGRALIADPDLPRKAEHGESEAVRECIACNRCYDEVVRNGAILCAVNPFAGKESTTRHPPVAQARHVLVIGGGCAGLEAAVTAAERGHRVTLVEKKEVLGGQVNAAANNPVDPEISSAIAHLLYRLRRTRVDVLQQCEATLQLVEDMAPDVVILATGARATIPALAGIDQPHVFSALDILYGASVEGRDAVIIGGGLNGACAAEYLHSKAFQVSMLKMSVDISSKAGFIIRKEHTHSLNANDIRIFTGCQDIAVHPLEVTFTNVFGKASVKADIVVNASGMRPQADLASPLKNRGYEVYTVGDAVQPREILEAVHEGFAAGNRV